MVFGECHHDDKAVVVKIAVHSTRRIRVRHGVSLPCGFTIMVYPGGVWSIKQPEFVTASLVEPLARLPNHNVLGPFLDARVILYLRYLDDQWAFHHHFERRARQYHHRLQAFIRQKPR